MNWRVCYHPDFAAELASHEERIRIGLAGAFEYLERFGPLLARPMVDTLKGSHYPNMKELRVSIIGEPWRVAFAFDPDRRAVVLVAGSKAGKAQVVFYRRLIRTADKRFAEHLKDGAQ